MLESLSTDEIFDRIKRIKEQLTKPAVRITRKTQIRKKKGKLYRYIYYYAQYEIKGKTVTKYLGKQVPDDILEQMRLRKELRTLKQELRRRLRI